MEIKTYALEQIKLFNHINPAELEALLSFLGCHVKTIQRKKYIYHVGDQLNEFGIVLNGEVRIENVDFWGNTSIIAHLSNGAIFAESYVLANKPLSVDVIAQKTSEILFISTQKLFQFVPAEQSAISSAKNTLVQNLLLACSQKNLHLSHRIFHTSSKTIRGRVISYLSFLSKEKESASFDIPFNRQQLADYLNVDRSALSHELSKMQKDGLITINKNHFSLNDKVM